MSMGISDNPHTSNAKIKREGGAAQRSRAGGTGLDKKSACAPLRELLGGGGRDKEQNRCFL